MIAAKSGKKVLLVDEKPEHGGSLVGSDNEVTNIDNKTPKEWIKKLIQNLSKK